jgi:hypothetical protein
MIQHGARALTQPHQHEHEHLALHHLAPYNRLNATEIFRSSCRVRTASWLMGLKPGKLVLAGTGQNGAVSDRR